MVPDKRTGEHQSGFHSASEAHQCWYQSSWQSIAVVDTTVDTTMKSHKKCAFMVECINQSEDHQSHQFP